MSEQKWCWHVSPTPGGDADWWCIPDEDRGGKSWDRVEEVVRQVAEEQGDEDEPYAIRIVYRPVRKLECRDCSAPDCRARMADYE